MDNKRMNSYLIKMQKEQRQKKLKTIKDGSEQQKQYVQNNSEPYNIKELKNNIHLQQYDILNNQINQDLICQERIFQVNDNKQKQIKKEIQIQTNDWEIDLEINKPCVICYGKNLDVRRCLDCKQLFCILCAKMWVKQKNQCPFKCCKFNWNIDLREKKQKQSQNFNSKEEHLKRLKVQQDFSKNNNLKKTRESMYIAYLEQQLDILKRQQNMDNLRNLDLYNLQQNNQQINNQNQNNMLNLGVNSHQHIPFSNFADDIQNIETESETSMELQDLEEKDSDQNKEQRFKNIRQLLNLNQLQDTQQILNNIKSPTRNRSQINILDQNRQKRIQQNKSQNNNNLQNNVASQLLVQSKSGQNQNFNKIKSQAQNKFQIQNRIKNSTIYIEDIKHNVNNGENISQIKHTDEENNINRFQGYNLPKNYQPYLQELRNKRRLSNHSSSSQNNRNKNRSQDQQSKKQLIQEQFQQNQRQYKQQFNFNFKGQNFQVLRNGHL